MAGPTLGPNPAHLLPSREEVADLPEVARLVSPPFAEYAELILKISHNLGADLMAPLIATAVGERTFEAGMLLIGEILADMGLDVDSFAGRNASGSEGFATPRTTIELLRIMRSSVGASAYFEALPILGVDGSLVLVGQDSPARGRVHAKTGSGVTFDALHGRPFLTEKALAGYIQARSGRLLAFALFVENGLMEGIPDAFLINEDLGDISALIWETR